MDEKEITHRRRLAQILRYIASMHHSLQDVADLSCSFVRENQPDHASDFFQDENGDLEGGRGGVLLSTKNFRHLLSSADPHLFDNPPFTFYAAAASTSTNKRTIAGTLKSFSPNRSPDKACWLRLTRLTNAQLSKPAMPGHPEVHRYLDDWLEQSKARSLDRLMTLRRIQQAPKIPPSTSHRGVSEIKQYLKNYRTYLRKSVYQRQLEPIYNTLFEYIQQQSDDELIWGLGHARALKQGNLVNGPVLEIHMEVELARDGALLVRPREHAGVALNREVVTALSSDPQSLQQLYRMVNELEPSSFSPGQPNTYISCLKEIALKLSSDGRFVKYADLKAHDHKVIITENWCLFSRPKPNSVWARDAMTFADELLKLQASQTIPRASWSLTHGPASLHDEKKAETNSLLQWFNKPKPEEAIKPLFPLPTSTAQNRIADLLLNQKYPAVVCEGPPGTGKTQTIANMICAYLCRGKRVLVTSKNAPALSVLRTRLPESVQELCVDVSMSELSGMRQLQKTVERLANKVASSNSDMEQQKYLYLQRNISEHEKELEQIDRMISTYSESIRKTVKHPDGKILLELAVELTGLVPWLMSTICKWSPKEVEALKNSVAELVADNEDELRAVSGFSSPPTQDLISLIAAEAGSRLASVSFGSKATVAAIPILGSLSGMSKRASEARDALRSITIRGAAPASPSDWEVVLKVVKRAKSIHDFRENVWKRFQLKDEWPDDRYLSSNEHVKELHAALDKALKMKKIAWNLNVWDTISHSSECRSLYAKQSILASRIRSLAEEVVKATVVSQLSNSFSIEAQSALIRFSQIAGKAKFSKSSQPSRMTQRQRRKRQEYLDAFDSCCRFIPCWILTTSQISDYLPAECLFDLVIIDESSQSDVTVLPGMLRGKQWLIVGDGKQVSPTESFVSEEQIDSLRAALPSCPLESSLLPGQSFFDLCAQAFPKGRVVLNEHFRCASEIIAFSNQQFYDGALVPLRLPLKSERINPSIVDFKVAGGSKNGKVNEKEADAIVNHIQSMVADPVTAENPRSVGVISLMGEEQSRLIRGRLLDVIGPVLMAKHSVLVGDAPTFQGNERDIIALSMVCSPGFAPTQNQLLHFQRANVALSRARDQMILFRSLDISDIPNNDDMKIPIIDFFQTSGTGSNCKPDALPLMCFNDSEPIHSQSLLRKLLVEKGYIVRSMGIIWKNGLSVEHPESDTRAAVLLDCTEQSSGDWRLSYTQQKAIERVGWKCLRVDALSFLVDTGGTLEVITRFLAASGVEPPIHLYDELEDEEDLQDGDNQGANMELEGEAVLAVDPAAGFAAAINFADEADEDVPVEEAAYVVISSDEEGRKRKSSPKRSRNQNDSDEIDENVFGDVVDLGFLRGDDPDYEPEDSPESEDERIKKCRRKAQRSSRQKRRRTADDDSEADANGDSAEDDRSGDDEYAPDEDDPMTEDSE